MAKSKAATRSAEGAAVKTNSTDKVVAKTARTNAVLSLLESLSPARVALLVVLASCLAYANSLGGDFVFDDIEQIVENKDIRSWDNLGRAFTTHVWAFRDKPEALRVPIPPPYYRPLFTVLFTVEYQFFGMNPQGWHLVNLLLHILCSLGVYYVLRELAGRQNVAIVAALLFAVYPIHVESVSWISGVTDPLFGVFFLASYYFYLRRRSEKKGSTLLWSLLMFALAAFSKETALSLVALIFVSEWIASGETAGRLAAGSKISVRFGARLKPAVVTTLPYFGVAILYLIPRFLVLGGLTWHNPHAYHGPFLHTLLTLPWVVCTYLFHLLVPVNLSIAYFTSFETSAASLRFLLPALMLALLVGLVVAYRRRFSREVWYALALFVVPMLPVLDLRQLSVEYLIFDRYLYLSVAGWAFLLALGAEKLAAREEQMARQAAGVSSLQRLGLASAGVVVLLLLMTAATARENRNWSSAYALWSNAARIRPEFWAAHYNAGLALLEAKQYSEARDALNSAAAVAPGEPTIFDALGRTYTAMGETSKAVESFKHAIEIDPQMFESLNNLGNVYFNSGDYRSAERYYKSSLSLRPQAVASRFNLALCYSRQNRHREAAVELERALEYAPADAEILYELGVAYEQLGRKDDATSAWQRGLSFSKAKEMTDKISESLKRSGQPGEK